MPPQSETMDLHRRNNIESRHPSPSPNVCDGNSQNSAAPRSVYLTPIPLTRELSDLSGSYANGSSGKRSVPGTVYQDRSLESGPWRQAYVASKLPPVAAKTISIADGHVTSIGRQCNETEEFVDERADGILELSSLEKQRHNRIPVNVLLMDGPKHTYELLQIWIDRAVDSVRDVVQGVQRGIPDNWKIGYDGIFQLRGNRFTQMIHILKMAKYDVQPNEILIAKPWSITAQVTISFATSAIRYLTSIQVINTDEQDKLGRRNFRPKSEDSPLLLSTVAQKRIYSPNVILTHHHATRFLTFSPPFNGHMQPIEQSGDDTSSNISSIGMGSNFQGVLVDDLMKSLQNKSQAQHAVSDGKMVQPGSSPKSDLQYPSITFEEPDIASIMSINQLMRSSRDESSSSSKSRRNASCMMSQLNCWKTRERVAALSCCPQPEAIHIQDITFNCCRAKDINHSLLPSVDEEKCNTLDARPVDEASSRHRYYPYISAPSLSGIETDASVFYVMRGKTRVRLMEI